MKEKLNFHPAFIPPPSSLIPAFQRDDLNLHTRITRQPRRLHSRTRWRILHEVSPVNFVHRREIIHIDQKNCCFDDALHAASGCFKHGTEITHHLFSLFRDSARDELTRLRIERNLPRSEDETSGTHSLRIRPDGRRRALSLDDLPHYLDSLFFHYSNKLCILTKATEEGKSKRKPPRERVIILMM